MLKNVYAVVHFSAVNPYPNATWGESAQSMDHTFTIFQAAVMHKGENSSAILVFASFSVLKGNISFIIKHSASSDICFF